MLNAWISLSCSFKQCLISYYVQSIILDTLKNMKMYKRCINKDIFLSSGYSVTVENKHAELELKVVSEKHINSSMNQIFWKLEEDMQMTPPLWQKVKTN